MTKTFTFSEIVRLVPFLSHSCLTPDESLMCSKLKVAINEIQKALAFIQVHNLYNVNIYYGSPDVNSTCTKN